jgi:hypothetical protein
LLFFVYAICVLGFFSDMMFMKGLKDLSELFLAFLNFGSVLKNFRKL